MKSVNPGLPVSDTSLVLTKTSAAFGNENGITSDSNQSQCKTIYMKMNFMEINESKIHIKGFASRFFLIRQILAYSQKNKISLLYCHVIAQNHALETVHI